MTIHRTLSLLTFLGFALLTLGQSGNIHVRYIGNCGMQLSDGELDVFVDFPYKSGAYGYMTYDSIQLGRIPEGAIFIFTHRHADHYSKKLVKPYKARVYGPWKNKVKTAGDTIINDTAHAFIVQAYSTKHRFARYHYSYLITWHGKRIFISGDTTNPETAGSIPQMDIAFAPTWLLTNAFDQHIKLHADRFAVYHLYPDQQVPVEDDRIQLMRQQDEVITIPY